ncbi:MAG TPA: RidA family protein [Blastocatellia bacterium]|nr:RidA family protein [Blastocatellia bacterium]
MKKNFINPEALPDWKEFFTQVVAVEANGTKTVYVSGQVGVDAHQKLFGDGSFSAQAEQAFANLATALASANASLLDVVKLNFYVVNYQYEHAAVLGALIRQSFPAGQLPTCVLLGVQALARKEFLIEIEATAVCAN